MADGRSTELRCVLSCMIVVFSSEMSRSLWRMSALRQAQGAPPDQMGRLPRAKPPGRKGAGAPYRSGSLAILDLKFLCMNRKMSFCENFASLRLCARPSFSSIFQSKRSGQPQFYFSPLVLGSKA